jgi:hypothetical protein
MNAAPDLPVGLDLAMQGMPMRTASGRVLIGFPALRRALLQTPLGAPLAALFYLPGAHYIGRHLYRRIATRRRRDVCAPPQANGSPSTTP